MNNTSKYVKRCIRGVRGMKRKIPEVLTLEEQDKLLGIFNKRYYNSRKNKTMVKLFLNSGLRLSEMLDLKWRDINLLTGQLKVVEGKGGKDRILWVNDNMLEDLRMWREDQSNNAAQTEYVFSTSHGGRLDKDNVRTMLYKYSQKALNRKISPHLLRHTFATDLLRETKNIRLVQKALGHEDLSTTMIYTHIVDDELEQSLKLFRQK